MASVKKCRGNGKAVGFGCGVELPYSENNGLKTHKAKYGLGFNCSCYPKWLLSSDEGLEIRSKAAKTGTKKVKTDKKKEDRKKKQDLNTSGAMKSADTYFSRYIRLKNSNDGNCTCYTCGTDKHIKEVDNGHYMKREHKTTRYHENNCKPQCKICNGDTKHNGKQIEFRENLVNEIGEDKVVKIEKLSRTTIKANTKFYRDIADYYREKVNELQKKIKVKYW